MSVANDMSLFSLIAGASLPVQAVLVILLITSLFSWWYIFIKVPPLNARTPNRKNLKIGFGAVVI